MSIACDFHVHLYPCYNLDRAFDAAAQNLTAAGGKVRALCLTERADCRLFRRLSEEDSSLGLRRWSAEQTADPNCLQLRCGGSNALLLFAGRQIAALEGIELLALFSDTDIPDGVPFADAQAEALRQGALPVLNWALGKWMFSRRAIVEGIIASAEPSSLAICDTSLRPAGLPEPSLMRAARRKGLALLAGSDPLPFAGEEHKIGSYGLWCPDSLDMASPAASLRTLLGSGPVWKSFGRRSGFLETIRRNAALVRKPQPLLV